jgi:hypothetical protein
MSDVAYITVAIIANEEEAVTALKQVVGHLQWGGYTVVAGGATNEE